MASKNLNQSRAFIEINGKRYDASTGSVHDTRKMGQDVVAVSVSPPVALARKPQEPLRPITSRKVMDVRPLVPQHIKAHRPEHAQTLMRSAVTKPAPAKHLRAHTRTDILAKVPGAIAVVPKISFHRTDPKLEAHARQTPKSELIQRFSMQVFMPEPEHVPSPQERAAVRIAPVAQQPAAISDVFTRALDRADAHLEKPVDHKKLIKQARKHAKHTAKQAKRAKQPIHHRTPSLVAASLAVLLLTGFFAYQNKAGIELRYASAQAGFHASLPQYRPAGFALGKFNYRSGSVTVAYDNSLSNQSFSLSQQPSDWDSQTLLDTVVSGADKDYQAMQHNGRTIYIYGNNNAAWVTGGVLYRLSSNGSLSTSQVLDVAGSI